jgi:hypothetical protein
MIDTYEITVYALKSTRKNAKFIYKSFRVWNMEGAKKKFTDDNIADLKQWIKLSPYNLYNLVVYHNNVALVTWAEHYKSEYQIERQVIDFMNLINNGGF